MIEYKEGDLLGENKHKFIKEVERETRSRGAGSKYNVSFRRGEFECGLCQKTFVGKIHLIKANLVNSCGCLQKKAVKEYHENKKKQTL